MKILVTTFFVIALIAHETFTSEPISSEQKAIIMKNCFKLLRTPSEVRKKFTQMKFTDDDDGQDVTCVIRCGGIFSGMYDDESGWNVDMVVRQAAGRSGVEAYREAFGRCVAGEVGSESYGEDHCKKSFLQFRCGMKAWKEHIRD